MSHTRRAVFGRSSRQQKRGPSASRTRNRLGNIERLEDRVLLAADFNPWHNYAFPLDINGDFRVTPLDVLIAINAIKDGPIVLGDLLASGASAGEAEGSPLTGGRSAGASPLMLDVNNDKVVSALDVITVINAINAEGEGLVKLVKVEGTVTNDVPASASTPVTRQELNTVYPDDIIRLNVRTQDVRPQPIGVFSINVDIDFDPKAFSVVPRATTPFFDISYFNPDNPRYFNDPNTEQEIATNRINYPNGRNTVEWRPADGQILNAGGFETPREPADPDYGTAYRSFVPAEYWSIFDNRHVFDFRATVESLYATDDVVEVFAGGSQLFNVLSNDDLIVGPYTFDIGYPTLVGGEILVYEIDDRITEQQIIFDSPTVTVPLAGRALTFVGYDDSTLTKGQLTVHGAGSFTYTPFPTVTGPTTDTFQYTVSDNQGRTKTASVTISIESVNNPPVISAPAGVAMNERKDGDPAFAFTGASSVSITDADGEPMRVALATDAPIAVAPGSGVTFIDGDGSNGTLTFSGTQTQINNALAGLTYTPPAHFYGTPTLQITAQDLDNGTVLSTVNRTVTITVNPINDPPTVVVPGDQTVVTEDLPVEILGIEVADELDARHAPGGDVQGRLTLASTGGTLTVQNVNGLVIADNGTATVVITGLTEVINQALAPGVEFTGPVGTHTVTATMNDLGNIGPGPALEAEGTFQVTIVPPTRPFAVNDTFPVLEDSAGNVLQVLLNDFNFANQTGGTNLLITQVTSPTSGDAVITNNGTTITYTPAEDFFGTATFEYTIVDQTDPDVPKTESTASVTVNVALVNDQPDFTVVQGGLDALKVNEDSVRQVVAGWAVFDAGSPLENTVQSVKQYDVEVLTNPGLFSEAPNINVQGTLFFTPANHEFGEATFRARVQDDGGTDVEGAVDTSDWKTFTIEVLAVNDPPTFTASDPPTVNEDSGPQVIENWATDFVPGPPNESDQVLEEYLVTAGNPDLFAVLPSVDLDGTLSYTPADDAFGTSTFTVVARDSGGTDRGGDDKSAPQTFTITVLAVNDPPSFEVDQKEITVKEDAGLQTIEGWVTEFTPGPPNESDQQVLQYIISDITNPGLFAALPSVSNDGTLTFQSALHAWGASAFTVVVQDDGDTERDGIDKSEPKTIEITVTAVNDAPVNRLNGNPIAANDQVFTNNDMPLAFTTVNSARLTVTDVDVNDDTNFATFSVELSVTNGTLLLGEQDTPSTTQTIINVTLAELNTTLGTLIFSPDDGFIGTATLTITTNDGGTFGEGPVGGLDAQSVLEISVAPLNRPPIARDDAVEMPEGGVAEFNVFADNGFGADSAGPNEDGFQSIRVIGLDTSGTLGTVQLLNAATGDFRYTPPDPHFNEQTTFVYTIQDNGQSLIDDEIVDDFLTDSATVTITVWEVNDPPVAEDDLVLIDPQPEVGQQFRFHVSDLLSNDRPGPANESHQNLTIISVSTSAKGVSVELVGDEIFYWVPEGFDHVDTFEYTVQDDGTTRGQPDPKTATATVTVRDVVLSTISGYVYVDVDGNGQKDDGEPGIAGVRIELSGTTITGETFAIETFTDEQGRYEFRDLLPSQGDTVYTIVQPQQPSAMIDGQTTAGQGATVSPNQIEVHVPLLGFDTADSVFDSANFGEAGLKAAFSSIPLRDLLHSDLTNNSATVNGGLLFSTDAAGNLQWFMNLGGWDHYIPGLQEDPANPNGYVVQIVDGTLWVTNGSAGTEHQLNVPWHTARLREVHSNGETVNHIIGTADYFADQGMLSSVQGEGEATFDEADLELIAASSAGEQYSEAVDSLFASSADGLV